MTNTTERSAKTPHNGNFLRTFGFLLLTLSTFITMFLYAVVIRFTPIPTFVFHINAALYNIGLLFAAIGFVMLQSVTKSGVDLAVLTTLFLAVGVSLINMVPQMGVARLAFQLLSVLYFVTLAVRVFPQNKALAVLLLAAFAYQLITSLFAPWIIETVTNLGILRPSLFKHGMRLCDVICCVLCLLAVHSLKVEAGDKN